MVMGWFSRYRWVVWSCCLGFESGWDDLSGRVGNSVLAEGLVSSAQRPVMGGNTLVTGVWPAPGNNLPVRRVPLQVYSSVWLVDVGCWVVGGRCGLMQLVPCSEWWWLVGIDAVDSRLLETLGL